MARIVQVVPEPGQLTPAEQTALWAMQDAWRHRERKRIEAEARTMAEDLAMQMLSDRPNPRGPEGWSLAAWHWRARHLGPETALRDLALGIEGGWSSRFWTADGRLKPLPMAPPPDRRMARQHAWLSEGGGPDKAQAEEMPWPPEGVGG